MAEYGSKLNEILGLLTDIFGEKVILKVQELLGEQWTKILEKVIQRIGFDASVSGYDFVGGGLVLAIISAAILLIVGILLEKTKPVIE